MDLAWLGLISDMGMPSAGPDTRLAASPGSTALNPELNTQNSD